MGRSGGMGVGKGSVGRSGMGMFRGNWERGGMWWLERGETATAMW
jgi:hypothetical protein